MKIKSINYKNTLHWVLIMLSVGLYSCKKEIHESPEIKNVSSLSVQDARDYFEYNHKNTNKGIDWNRAIILNSNSPGRIIKVPVVENLVKNTWILKDLMFQKDTAGNIQEVVYALSVDSSYFSNKKRGNKKISNLRREINDKDFTGKILLYTVNNKLIKGREYLNGALIHDILPKTATRSGGKLMWTDPDKDKQKDIDKGIPLEEVDITAPHLPAPERPDVTLPAMPDWSFPGGSNGPGDYIPGGDPVGGGGDSGSAATTVTINIEGPKVDPKNETKCFNVSEGATAVLTIYVQQPNENSRDKMGENSVGHTFVGIQQGGITRLFGFYPDSPYASLLGSQKSEIHDNSNTLYHVSVSTNINASELIAAINYINNYQPTYDLNKYNCSDFAIAVAQKGGMNLPQTVGSYNAGIIKFEGHNPGDLGQDLRNAALPAGTTRTTTKTNAPKKNGGC